jgi:tetratricopeptide (TPR) repeat protein
MTGPAAGRRTRPRIAVYSIALNEEAHVERWAHSTEGADLVLLVDTGSTDRTEALARSLGVRVEAIRVQPFRFDVARNRALDLLPEEIDLCISLDLDEVLVAGWRAHVEEAWRQGATKVLCRATWPWSDVYPPLHFRAHRIHARKGYRWQYPVHERIVSDGPEVVVETPLEILHLRDTTATRPLYLDLLRLSVLEHPDDGRIAHLLAGEARRNGLTHEAHYYCRRALELGLEPHERLHALILLSYLEPESQLTHILTACEQFPGRREPWCELAQWYFDRGAWRACRAAALAALRIEQQESDHLTNVFAWGPWPEQMAAEACIHLGDADRAVHHAQRALRAAPRLPELADLLRRALLSGRRAGPS